ncbi:MAG: hypothetical protein K6C97_01570 [Treponema sp.]|nr:hypothetical protein [Treponema sp.]
METRSLEEVQAEIDAVKAELQNVHGSETEVYARIVGYYRAVKHWNNGKKDEFYKRKVFTLEDSKEYDITARDSEKAKVSSAKIIKDEDTNATSDIVSYKLYTKKTCPNCPPVKNFMSEVELQGTSINVDTDEGLADAAQNGVFATPTVIFYNNNGKECARCHNVEELETVLNKIAVTA